VSLASVPEVPAMTTPAERQLFYWLTRHRFTGAGAVVELGCWLGAGTAALAAGLRDQGSSARVVAVDRFRWNARHHPQMFDAGLADGEDFEPLLRAHTRELEPWIETVRADLAEFRWGRGPIEILVVDAPKRRADVERFLEVFGPSLIPGRSLVAFQDYLHEPSYALPALLGCFPEVFRLADVALPGATVLFEVREVPSLDAERRRVMDLSRWSAEETIRHWRQRVLEPLPSEAHLAARIGLALLLHDQGHEQAALAELHGVVDEPKAARRLQRLAEKSLYFRYEAMFRSIDMAPKRTSHELHLNQAKAHLKAGRYEDAAQACEAALTAAPGNPDTVTLAARIERERSVLRRSVRALRRLFLPARRPRRLR
jgi:predicted O-methyltransferase YrrM